jgi:zinc protease
LYITTGKRVSSKGDHPLIAALILTGLTNLDLHGSALPNGLEVFTLYDPSAPVVTVCVAVKTGATCETPETNGLAHFYEHMFFKGNAALPDQTAYNERMRALGIIRNGTTSREVVKYYITLGSSRFEEGMEFMRDAMLTPLFDSVEMERERSVITDEYLRNSSSSWWAFRKAVENTVYPEPWRGSAIGALEVIQSASPGVMRHFRETYYTPDNAALFIIGDISEDSALSAAGRYFGEWESGGRSDYDSLGPAVSIPGDTTVTVQGPPGVGYIQIVLQGPTLLSDRESTYAGDVWGTYLGLASRRFQRNLVTEGPFTEVYGGYTTQRFSPMITLGGMIEPGLVEEGLALLNRELDAMVRGDYFDPGGVEIAASRLRRERLLARESSRDLAIETLPFWWVQGSGIDYYLTYEEGIALVDPGRIGDFVEEYIAGKPRAVFLVTPDGGSR